MTVGVGLLTGCRRARPEDQTDGTDGDYVWMIENVRPCRNVPVRGRPRLFDLEPEIQALWDEPGEAVGAVGPAVVQPIITTPVGYDLDAAVREAEFLRLLGDRAATPHRSAEWWAGWYRLEVEWTRVGGRALSPYWAEWVRDWGAKRREIIRIGRRGGKSSMLEQLACTEALWSTARVPTGDVGVVPIVSVDRREASNRIRAVGSMLDALGIRDGRAQVGEQAIKRKSYSDRIELDLGDRGLRAVRVFTATVAGVSGFTSICALCDEVAKWRDMDTGSNPAAEVLASLAPTMATQPAAVMLLSSSPWGESDAHAEAFALGDTPGQRVSYAPSWVANPTLSEESTHKDEPDEETWKREYLGIPMKDVAAQWFDPRLVQEACT